MIGYLPKLIRAVVGKRLGTCCLMQTSCHVMSLAYLSSCSHFRLHVGPGLGLREEHSPFSVAAQGHGEARVSQYSFVAKVTNRKR